MYELTSYEIHQLMQRFPSFELSYETHPHKKVSPEYNVCMAIPVGRKCFAWFTFNGDQNTCFFIELNREKKACKISVSSAPISTELATGTLLYGTLLENERPIFLADDIFYFCGIPTRNLLFSEKLGFLDIFFRKHLPDMTDAHIGLPMIWPIYQKNEYECMYEIPDKWSTALPYNVHHIQYRCLTVAAPFFNAMPSRKLAGATAFGSSSVYSRSDDWSVGIRPQMSPHVRMEPHKSQYKMLTVFIVMADFQFDVYHLFAYGRNKELTYCGVAYITNYKASCYMNGIFRKIRENANLDAIEESDDEDDFQDIYCDKYVDLKKQVQMECRWNMRFKKWEPLRKLDGSHKIVHISQLASQY
jgi:hypothetical protein